MMLWNANAETIRDWREQTKKNTRGYMEVARRHHENVVKKGTETINHVQEKILRDIADGEDLNEKQKRALKVTYDQMLKAASEESHTTKCLKQLVKRCRK